MRRTAEDLKTLTRELEADLELVAGVLDANRRAFARIQAGAIEDLDYAALGYTLHNLYGLIENACLRISKFFENGLSPSAWHKELLERMTLEIEDLRPAFFSREEFALVNELRAFRHVFRNLYHDRLVPQKVLIVQGAAQQTAEVFTLAVRRYTEFLRELARKLGKE